MGRLRICLIPPRGFATLHGTDWSLLIDALEELGLSVQEGLPTVASADGVVSLDSSVHAARAIRSSGIPYQRCALVLMEPRVTQPSIYRTARRTYGSIFAASLNWADVLKCTAIAWPVRGIQPPEQMMMEGAYTASLIAANKRSAERGCLYQLRRRVVSISNAEDLDLVVVGQGWTASVGRQLNSGLRATVKTLRSGGLPKLGMALSDLSLSPNHGVGWIPSKADALSMAPVSLVIENSMDYVSEKLIDALICGVTPIYVGPPLEDFDIPSEVAIQVPPSAGLIVEAARGVTLSERQKIFEASRKWLVSGTAQRHEFAKVTAQVAEQVCSAWRNGPN
jgi:hypothetical protein